MSTATRALLLVDQVHRVLGRHRADDSRTGWLNGLGETEGAGHPTSAGLRIGKNLPERRPGEPLDAELEWDRDGQYFHYLTKWMHALDSVFLATGDARFNLWAKELARAAHASFVKRAGGAGEGVRMYWKMSIDLSRPLVPSMGQHDPLDGLLTFAQLEVSSRRHRALPTPDLAPAIAELAALVEVTDLRTVDPLGLGGLLSDAWRVAHLRDSEAFDGTGLLDRLLRAAAIGLARYASGGEQNEPPSRRLAFRELGLAIGLRAVELIESPARSRYRPSWPRGASSAAQPKELHLPASSAPNHLGESAAAPEHEQHRAWYPACTSVPTEVLQCRRMKAPWIVWFASFSGSCSSLSRSSDRRRRGDSWGSCLS
ncbi:MAG TPA: hypothetical protein VF395_15455 [Polyangiaceae bacterium]